MRPPTRPTVPADLWIDDSLWTPTDGASRIQVTVERCEDLPTAVLLLTPTAVA